MLRRITQDLPALIRPMLVFFIVAVVSFLIVRYSNESVASAAQRRDAQQRAANDARTRVQKSGEERDLILKLLPAFYELERQGLVGQERRLDWLDALRVANTHADLYGVQYEISVQQSYATGDFLGTPNLDVRHSTMRLQFGVLHEEDLGRFLGALSAQGVGAFLVNQCSLSPMRKVEKFVNQPTLKADCELSWITMAVPPKKEVAK